MTINRRGFIAAIASAMAAPVMAQAPGVGDRGGYPAFGPNGRVQAPEPSPPRYYGPPRPGLDGRRFDGRVYDGPRYGGPAFDGRGGYGGDGPGRRGYRDADDYERRRDWDRARRRRMRQFDED